MTFLLIIIIKFLKDEDLNHAKLVNLISSKFNFPVFTVPRIYADELEMKTHFI